MTLSEKIIFVRSELLLTQVQLAKELGVFQVTTSRWESNKKIPQLIQESKFNKTVFDIADYGGVGSTIITDNCKPIAVSALFIRENENSSD